ncbi:MAG: hypothetical protein ACI85U_004154, partial [Candidatus Promineifilaceae bacterium]
MAKLDHLDQVNRPHNNPSKSRKFTVNNNLREVHQWLKQMCLVPVLPSLAKMACL